MTRSYIIKKQSLAPSPPSAYDRQEEVRADCNRNTVRPSYKKQVAHCFYNELNKFLHTSTKKVLQTTKALG